MAIIQGNAKQGSTRGFYPKVINGSLRFNKDDASLLTLTPDSAGSRTTWTYSAWVKLSVLPSSSANDTFLLTSASGSTETTTYINGINGRIEFYHYNGSGFDFILKTNNFLRDPSAWYHLVIVMDTTNATAANRQRIYINGVAVTSWDTQSNSSQNFANGLINNTTAQNIGGFNGTGKFDGYLANVHFIDGQALTPSDFGETKNGVWVAKDYAGTFGTNGFYLTFEDDTEVEAFNTVLYRGNGGTQSITGTGFQPDLVWVKRRDSTPSHSLQDSVRGPRGRLFSDTTAAEDQNSGVISFDSDGFTIDGTKNATGSNGSSYVAWAWDAGANNAVTGHSSVTYTGSSVIGNRVSGLPFSPDLLWLKIRSGQSDNHVLQDSVRGPTKRLFTNSTAAESTASEVTSFTNDGFILGSTDGSSNYTGFTYVAWAWDAGDGDPVSNTDGSITSTVKTNGDFSIISYTGVGPASAANEIQVGHGLTSKPDFVIVKRRNSTGDWFVFTDIIDGSNDYLYLNQTAAKGDSGNSVPTDTVINLGGSLNTSGGTYVAYAWRNVTGKQKFGTYTGTGTAPSSLINTGFRPGFLMIKEADGVDGWGIYDGSRNPLNPVSYLLQAQDSGAESSATANYVDFESNGFKVCTGGSNGNFLNESGKTYIYAAFAGSYSDYITDYNTDGSIDSRVKANQTTGFSICSFNSGASGTRSFGHGLGTTPSLCIFKERNSGGAGDHWVVWEGMTGNPATSYGYLNLTNAFGTDTSQWSNTAPTSTEFTFNSGYAWSTNQDMIAYCWAEKTGYSKFGSYTGNGSTSGPSETGFGFAPAWMLIKRTDASENWVIVDNTRAVTNPLGERIFANASDAESTDGDRISLESDGFTINTNANLFNASGGTYIYAAFADTREAAFWLDQSGNDNDWQPVNLDHNDTVADSPTNNFATWNPLFDEASGHTFADGNLKVTTKTTGYGVSVATIVPTAGKFYAEITPSTIASTLIGIRDVTIFGGNNAFLTQNDSKGLAYFSGGALYGTTVSIDSTGGASYTSGDVIGVAINYDDGEVRWYKNGTIQYTKTGLDLTNMALAVGDVNNSSSSTMTANFGQQPFKYDPPA